MAAIKEQQGSDTLSVEEMRELLQSEIRATTKAADLRIREFSNFANAYAAGEMTPEQAMDAVIHFQEKWGPAIPGIFKVEGMSDAEITAAVELAAGSHTSRQKQRAETQNFSGKPGESARG